jgi:hypothetical protein
MVAKPPVSATTAVMPVLYKEFIAQPSIESSLNHSAENEIDGPA